MKKPLPPLNSDEEAERFVDEADLSEYDLSGMKPFRLVLRERLGPSPVTLMLADEDLDKALDAARSERLGLGEYLTALVHEHLNRNAA